MKKRTVHNYTSNLELTSLLIRIQNMRILNESLYEPKFDNSELANKRINKYIFWHTCISDKSYHNDPEMNTKKRRLLDFLKSKVIVMSESVSADQSSYDRFGSIVLLMIKKILTKSQFSGYTYKDEFYSDATYKILKYLGNFNHKMISKRSGEPVNAFAYLTQIIHNSILFVINVKKKDQENVQKQAKLNFLETLQSSKDTRNLYFANSFENPKAEKAIKHMYYTCKNGSVVLNEIKQTIKSTPKNFAFSDVFLHFAPDSTFSTFEYAELSELLKSTNNVFKIGNRIDSIIYDEDNIIIKDE